MGQEILLVVGVVLVIAGLVGKVESSHFNVGVKSYPVRGVFAVGGVCLVWLYFVPPAETKLLIERAVTRPPPTLQVSHFGDKTKSAEGAWLSMKTERNLVELFSNAGIGVEAPLAVTAQVNRAGLHQLHGLVSPAGREVLISTEVRDPEGRVLATADLQMAAADLKAMYESIPAVLIYEMDIDPSSLKVKGTKRPPTTITEAFLLYEHARRKAARQSPDEALQLLRRATEVDPEFAMAFWSIARLEEEAGRISEANVARQRAASIDPDHPKWEFTGALGGEDPLPELLRLLSETEAVSVAPGLSMRSARSESYGVDVYQWWFDLDQFNVKVREQSSTNGITAREVISDEDVVFAIGAGFFELDAERRLSPSGLLVVDGSVRRQLSAAGSGVFAVQQGRPNILWSRDASQPSEYEFAVQSGPILVEPDRQPGIHSNDRNRLNRSAVCLAGTRLGFASVIGAGGNGLSLFEFAEILRSRESAGGLACDVALNLDGGPSAQFSLKAPSLEVAHDGLWRVHNLIVVSSAPEATH